MIRLSISSFAGPVAGIMHLTTRMAPVVAAICVMAATLLPQPASAQWVSTGELVDGFCSKDAPEEAAFCAGYVAGALHVLMAPPEMMPTGRFCIDVEKQPKLSAIADRMVKLRNEREDIAETPAFSVIAAIIERGFPCPEDMQAIPTTPPVPVAQPDAEVPSDLFGLPSAE